MSRSKGSYRKSGGDKQYSENGHEEPCADDFEMQLQRLDSMSVAHLNVMVRLAAREAFSQYQSAILAAALRCAASCSAAARIQRKRHIANC
jgi:hypothetical protein